MKDKLCDNCRHAFNGICTNERSLMHDCETSQVKTCGKFENDSAPMHPEKYCGSCKHYLKMITEEPCFICNSWLDKWEAADNG